MSRIGKKPIAIPKEVKIEVKDGIVTVTGPKGNLSRVISSRISSEQKEGLLYLKRPTNTKLDMSLHGLYRALIANMVKGVTEGYEKQLEIIGVGYKAQVSSNKLTMQLGFSHPVNFSIPEGIKIETPKPTQIIIRGIDKEKVGEIAAEIRAACPPEPYKGKGVRYMGEYIKKKIGKAQATASK
ncbi:MAG: 50S ribosomal protein L6 [Candidatus Omnitrophica bacterium]|nr:50S ribosomal protein L6 [Candidatus Omnitrophota bacterium]MDD5553291.1 50S ribosomal protein L6 [Candidatus Omnitrophota bacterium]